MLYLKKEGWRLALLRLRFGFFCLIPLISKAQSFTDTLQAARELAYAKNFTASYDLLEKYNSHRVDVNGIRLQAQVAYWINDAKKSAAILQQGLMQLPGNPYLSLDLGRLYYNLGQINKAEPLVEAYLGVDAVHPESLIMLANIKRWHGKTGELRQMLNRFDSLYPGNADAKGLREALKEETAPYLKTAYRYLSDDQPLTTSAIDIETGWYRSWALSPVVKLRWHAMEASTRNNSFWMQAGNQMYFGKTGTRLSLAAGLFQQQDLQEVTGQIAIGQQLVKNLWLEGAWEKRPYQHTVISTATPVMQQFWKAGLRFNKKDRWLGQAGYERQTFEDDNDVTTAYAWALAPVVQTRAWDIKAGYAFAMADACENTFRPVKTLPQIISSGPPITGIYDPYFTPSNQMTHSLLASLGYNVNKNIRIQTRASLGVSGRADNPYFYLAQGNGNNLKLVREFYEEPYTPTEIYGELTAKVSRAVSLSAWYQYSSLLFYTSHMAGIQLKINFINGQN